MAALLNEADARAELGGIGKTKLYELTSMGELKSVKLGRRRLWASDSLLAYVERLAADANDLGAPVVLPRPSPEHLRTWRRSHGLSLQDLASTVGTNPSTVAAWESGITRPNRLSVERLARAFGVTARELCGDPVAVAG